MTMQENPYTKVFPLHLKHEPIAGNQIILEPLEKKHIDELSLLLDPGIWRWYTIEIKNEAQFRVFMEEQLIEDMQGESMSYAIREKQSNTLIGGSRFLNISKNNRRVEIGSTWFSPSFQRTFANTETKLLMLSHAFEKMLCICAQLQTDTLNIKSRTAIERLGAKCDGILRFNRICHDGRIRDSVVYSITHFEWPDIKKNLETRLNSYKSI